jgi:hypothetical protein
MFYGSQKYGLLVEIISSFLVAAISKIRHVTIKKLNFGQ